MTDTFASTDDFDEVTRSGTPWDTDAADVIAALGTDPVSGLSSEEAADRLARFGPNEPDAAAPVPLWRRVMAQFADPLVGLLLIATAISVAAWMIESEDTYPVDAIVIVVIVIANAALGLWQEQRASDAVDALKTMTETRSRVVRDGGQTSIPSSDLVPGDIIMLGEGDAVGADARVIEAASLFSIEAPLTGESTPVEKHTAVLRSTVPVADRTNMVFSGTAIAAGRGVAVVTATGMDTEMGRIASLLSDQEVARTPLQREIARISKALGVGVAVIAVVVIAAIVTTSEISTASDVVEALLIGVSLAVAAVPEGLPAILSVVLALGVQRMAAKHAVVKKLSSVETLGSASVICTDKTGTLTRNEMTITDVVTPSGTARLTGTGYTPLGAFVVDGEELSEGVQCDEARLLLGAGSLANDADLRHTPGVGWETAGDPTEAAFLVAEAKLGDGDERRRRFDRVDELPFTSDRKMMSTLNADLDAGGTELVMVTKGAPDVILERCTRERRNGVVETLTPARRAELHREVHQLADQALRTLAVAYRPLEPGDTPLRESSEQNLVLLGVVGIIDPPRPEARTAIEAAHRAGIRVIVITGDHPITATRIAEELGLIEPGERSLTGAELEALSDDDFAEAVSDVSVFARVTPEVKLRIVESLQAQGNVVAMTGDGVNDAPALRRADIGVAMGITGTEVSKEAGDMILADDDFATIVEGVAEGRAIFTNISKFLRYLLATNVGEVLVMFLGIVGGALIGLSDVDSGLAVPLLATQILWINLLTDTGLALALGVDPAVGDPMSRPPRRLTDRIVDRSMALLIVQTGVVLAAAGLIAFDLELDGGLLGGNGGIETARTHLFTTLVLGSMFAAFSSRSRTVSAFVDMFTNRLLWAAAGLTVAMQIAVVHVEQLTVAFDTVPMSFRDWMVCAGLASSVLWVDEARKFVARRRATSSAPRTAW